LRPNAPPAVRRAWPASTMVLKRARKAASRRREILKARLLDVSGPLRRGMMRNTRDLVKDLALADPDMWGFVRGIIGHLFDAFFADVEREVERHLEHQVLKQSRKHESSVVEEEEVKGSACWRQFLALRAFLLFHWKPYNKSFFGQMKDPVYLAMFGMQFVPFFGVRQAWFALVLFLMLFPDQPDEFQLINFILMFKRTQFVTQGVLAVTLAGLKYFACYTYAKESMTQCVVQFGPGAAGDIADYAGSVLLIWTAFVFLPLASVKRSEETVYVGRVEDLARTVQEEHTAHSSRWVVHVDPTQGGRLGKLLVYDARCFLASLAVLALLLVQGRQAGLGAVPGQTGLADPQVRADIFWAKSIYAYTSLPFAIFDIPIFFKVLTHCNYTGYNERGECVPLDLPHLEVPEPEPQPVPDVEHATSILSMAMPDSASTSFAILSLATPAPESPAARAASAPGALGEEDHARSGADAEEDERVSLRSIAASGALGVWAVAGWLGWY